MTKVKGIKFEDFTPISIAILIYPSTYFAVYYSMGKSGFEFVGVVATVLFCSVILFFVLYFICDLLERVKQVLYK